MVVSRAIRANIGKIQIKRQQSSLFALANVGQDAVERSAKILVKCAHGVMAGVDQNVSGFGRQVLVNLELDYQVVPLGRLTVRSRANSAAYSSTAWTSSAPSDG